MSELTRIPKKRAKKAVDANGIAFRKINLHKNDIRDVTEVIFTTHTGEQFRAKFNPEPTPAAKMKADGEVYITLAEVKPYYNVYQVYYFSTAYVTNDLALASFVQTPAQGNPNYLYEF
jgi:hypothetical protein